MLDKEEIIGKAREFLFKTLNGEFLVFLFFFFLSCIFWLLLTLNDTYDVDIDVPVVITDVPKNVILTSEEHDTIRVTLHDRGLELLPLVYLHKPPTLSIAFKNHAKGGEQCQVNGAELQRMLTAQLPVSTKVTAIKPEVLTIYYNYGTKKRVKVEWRGTAEPDNLYFIAKTECRPDSVDIYASEEVLHKTNVVYTEMLDHTGFRDTLSVNVPLACPTGMRSDPSTVNLRFYTDILAEKTVANIPVKGINVPEGKIIRTFPSNVTVKLIGGHRQLKNVGPQSFKVVVDYRDIQKRPTEKAPLYLKAYPQAAKKAELLTREVDYLIEQQ